MAITNGVTPAESISNSQSAVNAARPSISIEIASKVSASISAVTAGVTNLKPGETPPANINVVNLSLGTYPSLGGLVVSQTELDGNIVQARRLQNGTWEKNLIPVTGLDRYAEKTALFEGVILNSFDPNLAQANTVFDTATGTIITSTSGRSFSGLQPAVPNTKYTYLGGAGPIYMFNAAREFIAYSQATAHNGVNMAPKVFVPATVYTTNVRTEFTTPADVAFISANGIVDHTIEQVRAEMQILSGSTAQKLKKELLPADIGEALMLDGVTKSPISVVTQELQGEFKGLFDGGSVEQIFDPNSHLIPLTYFNTDTAGFSTSTSRPFIAYLPAVVGQEYTILKGSGPVYMFNAAKEFVAYVSDKANGKPAMVPFQYVPALEYVVNERVRFVVPTGVAFFGANSISDRTIDQVKLEVKIYKGNITEGSKKIKSEYLPTTYTPSPGGSTGSSNYMMEMVAGTMKAYNRGTGVLGGNSILRFNFLFFSDIHYNSTNADLNLVELLNFARHPLIASDISTILCGGDVCNGQYGRTKATAVSEINSFKDRLLQSPVPAISILGNHDDNVSRTGRTNPTNTFVNAITKTEQYNLMLKPFSDKWNVFKTVANKGYFHADFDDHKIRVIGTDAYDWPVENNGSGGVKYKSDLAGQYFSQAQLDWLFTTLRDTPAGYAIILLTHCPVRTGLTWSQGFVQGVNVLPNIINAWKKGLTYNHSWSSSAYPELNTNKVFAFTGSGKEFICYLGGHVHSLISYVTEAFADQHGFVVPCTWTSGAGSGDAEETPTMVRGEGEEVRNSFACMSVDRFRKNLIVTMYGAHKDGEGFITERTNFIKYNV